MTRAITLICMAALTLAPMAAHAALRTYSNERPSPFANPVHEDCAFDVNQDGGVNVADAMFVLQAVVGLRELPHDCRPEDDED